jgi:hypothetical protein
MVVSPEGGFLTQRDTPRLALVVPTIEPEALTLEAPGMTPLTVPFAAPNEFSPLPLRRGCCFVASTCWQSSPQIFVALPEDIGAGHCA